MANWSRVIHGGMICVWEQTDGPCMFLLTLIQILGQIKDATWLLQTESSSDRAYFPFSASSTFKSFPALSPLLASFPQIPPLLLSLVPIFILSYFGFSFSSKWIHRHLPFLNLPDVSHFPVALSPHVGKTWVCVVCFCPALRAVQLRLHWAGYRFGLWSKPGPALRKWPLLWFKLATRQRNRAFCWRPTEEKSRRSGGREYAAICKPYESEW